MILTDICNSIEGERLLLQCRKFSPLRPRNDDVMKQLVFPFKLGISSLVTITEELNPKNYRFKAGSILDMDVSLLGETIDGFSLKPLGTQKIVQGSAQHKASEINTKGFAYAHVEIGLRALLQKREEK